MKKNISNSRFYVVTSIILAFLMLVLILPNEALAEKYHIDLSISIPHTSLSVSLKKHLLEEEPETLNKTVAEVSPNESAEIKSNSGKITLMIPKSAVEKPTEVEIIEYRPTDWTRDGNVKFIRTEC